MKSDGELEQDVRDELLYGARIDDPTDIAILAEFGEVTLRGTVPTFFQKRATENAVKRGAGVIDVDNRIDVRLLGEHRREDAEIRGDAAALDVGRPARRRSRGCPRQGRVRHAVGRRRWLYQANAAYEDVTGLVGVVGVTNELAIRSDQSKRAELADRIQSALVRNARTNADQIAISTHDGRVVLQGSVSSLAERHVALAAAWSAPGVLSVDDPSRSSVRRPDPHDPTAPVLTPEERFELGRAARNQAPQSSHAEWAAPTERPDPIALLEEQANGRVPDLVPIPYGRMAATPFAVLRGGACVMASDLADTPDSGLRAQLCGDAHLSNFGAFASPERNLTFDTLSRDLLGGLSRMR